jgi:hypothetical protein
MSTQDFGQYNAAVRQNGLRLNANEPLVAEGSATFGGTTNATGIVTVTGGITSPSTYSNTVWHSGGTSPFSGVAATSGASNVSVVSTDTYVCEVFVPINSKLTGISVLNGTAAAGDTFVGLADSTGKIVAKSATNVAASGTSTYQAIPFTTTYNAVGPATYFICMQGSSTSGRFNAHTIGNFGAVAVTSETYGTFLTTAAYSATAFTSAVGPVADVY